MMMVLVFVAEEEQDAIIEQQRKELEQKKKKEQEDSQTLEQTREHVSGVYLVKALVLIFILTLFLLNKLIRHIHYYFPASSVA